MWKSGALASRKGTNQSGALAPEVTGGGRGDRLPKFLIPSSPISGELSHARRPSQATIM